MPHSHDVEHSTAETTSEYECLQCGRIVENDTNPGTCAACGGEFQNRAKSLE
ncbi:rubrerythrin-like domain-containing protein [Haloplanus litoreus]|uniref:Rubrerythrin-like domain-containing protein n=1 Tax=Haloplanus litoreus TaxID=767515 RepID=A0ABD5ZZC2_9EURY